MTITFKVDGGLYSAEAMLAANADDADLCKWIEIAKPGDVFPALVECECVDVIPASAARHDRHHPHNQIAK